MPPGNSIPFWFDAAGQLNSMLGRALIDWDAKGGESPLGWLFRHNQGLDAWLVVYFMRSFHCRQSPLAPLLAIGWQCLAEMARVCWSPRRLIPEGFDIR
jgi:hypothetical protein